MSEDDFPIAGFFLFFNDFLEPEEYELLLEKKRDFCSFHSSLS